MAYAAVVKTQRPRLIVVPDAPLAPVRDISSAPSLRRRREQLREDSPADARRPLMRHTSTVKKRGSYLRAALAVGSTVVATVGAIFFGLALQPQIDPAATVVHSVQSGESVWSIAASLDTQRPLEDIVTDIYRLNDISGGLAVGQMLRLPTQ
ncbi:LysM peptidoglycan-binding domain-containing protein [Schaalia suimastitidis]|uniref:LysM peptidoglycan-binding domain-containing protein n=1 Tax=Schaalia suimastitidis TaxID=121163 RepID=UPI00040EDD37|nr:LysM peptidoglycan-binding domain-containing protein [Schaalia suimastitidis]